ncbi:MAG: hypothetical protein KDC18_02810 [Alphaproteobacteria bacterium]|nr:hypothetical protein [Alphaproteobacteria bacterium]MCB9930759.1 hypothetical protein [Alphaproteobacteria bacterium]
MLLRGSGDHTGNAYRFEAVMDGTSDSGVADADLLLAFADAVHTGDFVAERAAVRTQLGEAALVDAAATIAIFTAVVKIADATGIPLEDAKADTSAGFRDALGIDGFARS